MKVIEHAIREARSLNHNYVGTEHLLLGLLHEPEGVAAKVLEARGLRLSRVRGEVLNLLGSTIPASDVSENANLPRAHSSRELELPAGQSVRIGDAIEVTVVRIGPEKVRLSIQTPPEWTIHLKPKR